ncbi:hypothetical protein [Halarchaeum salinum]|uniref:Ribbon-helix-helix protein, CopG family n=1 Tax=Halarchaeum salinum TaxID=489912 RepID=A0AAV3S4H2_9EURY
MTTRLSIDIDDELHKEFSKAVIDVDETKADVVRELVREWVDEQNE